MFEKIKKFYEMGLYSKQQVRQFYIRSVITQEEYETIVKEG